MSAPATTALSRGNRSSSAEFLGKLPWSARRPFSMGFLAVLLLTLGLSGQALADTGQIGNFCASQFVNPANCTANDVLFESFEVIEVIESCTQGTLNEAEVVFDAVVESNSPDRYGIGLFINLDGESAITGDRCLHDFLSPFSSNPGDWNEVEVNGGVLAFAEPFPNLNGDQCGDIPGNSRVVKQLQQVRITCNDLTGDGFVDINACASWENNQNSQCNGLEDAIPGTPSKCGCTDVETGLALPASLTIRKVTTDDDDTFEFETTSAPVFDQSFSLPDTFEIATVNGVGEEDFGGAVEPGTYTIDEVVPDNWRLDSVSCTNGDDPTPDGGGVTLGPGDEVTCTFINSPIVPGSVTIIKNAQGGDASFGYTGDLGDFNLTTVGGTDSQTFNDVSPGTYDVTESVPAGWDLVSITCSNDSDIDLGGATASVNVGEDESVSCTFTNAKRGSITISKVTQPTGGEGFDFVEDITPTGSFTLDHGEGFTFDDLVADDYSVTEQVPSGWDLTGISCTGGSDVTTDPDQASVDIGLNPGEEVECTFTNTQRGSLTVVKNTLGGNDTFDFTSQTLDPAFEITTVANTGSFPFDNIAPGFNYDVTEILPAGWVLDDASCEGSDDWSFVDGEIIAFVGPGDEVTCTFTNTKLGSLTVKKISIGGDGEFDFFSPTLEPDEFSIPTMDGEGYSQVFDGLQPDTYDVFEVDPGPEWAFQNVSCNVAPEQYEQVEDGQGNIGFSLDLLAGQEVVCTFENGLLATVSVTKRTIGGDGTFGFDFERGAELVEAFDLITSGGTANREFENLAPGSYSFTETILPANWELTDVYCTHNGDESSGDLENATVAFELEFGDTVNCAFENTADGKIIVRKFTDPEGSEQEFEFVGPEGSALNGFLTDGGELEDYFQPGDYTVSEIIPDGWADPVIVCETEIVSETARLEFAGIQGIDVPRQASETINLAAGETVICEFRNTQLGSLTIVKATDPAGSSREFTFTGDAAGTLTDGESIALEDLMPAVYTSAEDVPEGWSVSIACEGAVNSGVTIGENDVEVDLAAGEDVTCTFTNTIERGSITVTKVADPDDTGQVFQFTSNFAGDFGLAHGQSEVAGNLVPSSEAGPYSVSETVPDGWDLLSATCDNGDEPDAIDLQPGQDVICTFTNAQDRGEIIVAKVADPDDTAQTFQFNPSWGANFSLGAGQSQGSGPLVAGSYSVSETVPAGWTLDSAVCDNGDDPSAISLGAGETVTCTFTNAIDRGTIVVNKVADPSDTGQQFSFSSNFAGDFTLGAGGSLSTDNLLPSSEAGTYSVSETVPAEWTLESAVCDGGNTPEAIDLQPGQTVTCTFTNLLRQIVIDRVEEICENDAPFVDYEIQTLGFGNGNGLTIRWVFVSGPNAGEPAEVLSNQPLSGRLLWPGAEIDADGQGINWPGWEFIPGEGWIEVPTNLRPSLLLEFEANPTVSQVVNYPPATTVCSPRPPADPEDPIRVPTLSAFGLIILAMLMLLLAGFGMRRHGLTR